MTTLVTGAFGCIGAWTIRGLLAAGERPVVFDLGDDPWRVRMIAGDDAPSRVVVVRGDITDRDVLGRVVRDHYNLHGASASVRDVVRTIESAWPAATGLITHVEQPIPFPAALDDARYQKDLGPTQPTSLADGVRKTLDEVRHLQKDGRLDGRELA